jgi:hypothetical protein
MSKDEAVTIHPVHPVPLHATMHARMDATAILTVAPIPTRARQHGQVRVFISRSPETRIWGDQLPSGDSNNPMETVERIALWLLPRVRRNQMMLDLGEDYPRVVARLGLRQAKLWCWKEMAWTVICCYGRPLARWAALDWVAETARRWMGM